MVVVGVISLVRTRRLDRRTPSPLNCYCTMWVPNFKGSRLPLSWLPRTGVMCNTWALQLAVIPAKAGIHFAILLRCAVDGLDSRFRGNDWRPVRDTTPKLLHSIRILDNRPLTV
jgi:hypothetical protein